VEVAPVDLTSIEVEKKGKEPKEGEAATPESKSESKPEAKDKQAKPKESKEGATK
jgi:hypothetical protein